MPNPELDWLYLLNEENTETIAENIKSRKGVGDIHKMVSFIFLCIYLYYFIFAYWIFVVVKNEVQILDIFLLKSPVNLSLVNFFVRSSENKI